MIIKELSNKIMDCPNYIRERRLSEMQSILQAMRNTLIAVNHIQHTDEPSGMETEEYMHLLNSYTTLAYLYPDIKLHGEFYDCMTEQGVPYSSTGLVNTIRPDLIEDMS